MLGHRFGKAAETAQRRGWSATDRRYSTYRWRKMRLIALRRDGFRCWVAGCLRTGNVADHVRPVGPDTTDAEFYDPRGLRASCRGHNLARPLVGDAHEAAFGMVPRDGGLPRTGTLHRTSVITRDYTRKP